MSNLAGQYDYDVAQKVLNETDKNRFLCCYLNIKDTTVVDWEKAAKDFGSASVDSFKKMISNALKKVKHAQENGVPEAANCLNTKATPKRGGKGKRKGGDEDAAEDESPTKRAKATPKKGNGKKSAETVEEGDAKGQEIQSDVLQCNVTGIFVQIKLTSSVDPLQAQADALQRKIADSNKKEINFTAAETKFLTTVIKNLEGNINADFNAVAAETGYKDANVARIRWNEIRRKKILGGEGSDATPKKRKAKAVEEEEDGETPKKRGKNGKARKEADADGANKEEVSGEKGVKEEAVNEFD